jgi:L-lactate dehydrogenase complex protein LldG
MTISRDIILARIRKSLHRGELSDVEQSELANRMLHHQRGILPKRAELSHTDLVDLFIEQAKSVLTTIYQLQSLSDVSSIILDYFKMNQNDFKIKPMPLTIYIGNDPIFEFIEWHPECIVKKWHREYILNKGNPEYSNKEHSEFIINNALLEYSNLISLTSSFCGVAETGTIVLLSSLESPTTLNFLPTTHFVLLSTQSIVAYYEDAWDMVRANNTVLPRTVNFITGPSRTADIEQTIQMGMHGPKELIILLYSQKM